MKYHFLIAINLVFQCLSYSNALSQERCCKEETDPGALPPLLKFVSWDLSFLSSDPATRKRRSVLASAPLAEQKHNNRDQHHYKANSYSSRLRHLFSSRWPHGHGRPHQAPVRSPRTRHHGHPHALAKPSDSIQPLVVHPPAGPSQALLLLSPAGPGQPLHVLPLRMTDPPELRKPSSQNLPLTSLQPTSQSQSLTSLQSSNQSGPLSLLQSSSQAQPLTSLQPSNQNGPLSSLQSPSQGQPLTSLQSSNQGGPLSSLQSPSQGQPLTSLQSSNQSGPLSSLPSPIQGQPLPSLKSSNQSGPLSSLQLPSQGQLLSSLHSSNQSGPLSSLQLPSQGQPRPSLKSSNLSGLLSPLQLPSQGQPLFSLQPSSQGQPLTSLQSSNESGPLSSLQPSSQGQLSLQTSRQGQILLSLQPSSQGQFLLSLQPSSQGQLLLSLQPSNTDQPLVLKLPDTGLQQPSPSFVTPVPPENRTSSFMNPSRLVRRGAVILSHCGADMEWNVGSQAFRLSKFSIQRKSYQACGQRTAFKPKLTPANNEEAEKGEFPWMVSLKLSIYHFCSGSILNRWWILTTASCTNIIKNEESSVLVQAGMLNFQLDFRSFHVELVVSHQEYTEDQETHNLGLILLREPLFISPLISPICISKNIKLEQLMTPTNCWISEWTSLQGGPSILLKRRVSHLQHTLCSDFWPIISDFTFCMKLNPTNMTNCKGDIGAPLVCKDFNSSSWLQVGLLSDYDKTCVKPYVFTKVSHYLSWIEQSTQAAGKPISRTKSTSAGRLQKKWLREKGDLHTAEKDSMYQTKSFRIFAPWQTLIITCQNKICNGAILDKYWIVTTAGCVQNMDPDDTAVYMGLNRPEHIGDVIRADRIFPHDGHDESVSVGNDIALILLEGPILFWKHARPLTMARDLNLDISSMDTCGIAGLRWLESGKESSSTINLKKIQVPVKNSEVCPEDEALIQNVAFCIEEVSTHRQLLMIQEGSAILCTSKQDSNWTLVGILSKVLDESPMPALITRLAAHIDWMNNVSKAAGRPLELPPTTLSQKDLEVSTSRAHTGLVLLIVLLSCFVLLIIIIGVGAFVLHKFFPKFLTDLKSKLKLKFKSILKPKPEPKPEPIPLTPTPSKKARKATHFSTP
ncbi:transmembrane protease serine 9-like [Rhinatrema bivittatum]|uniref:transmembrane protease serine 9-like n=1 Tax=Rhinatrema bivittatum TaxID=194408 RepID=UPI00112C5735|nr:transmembrane protease serine 9-like [Rhinatrema bivittatum]